MPPGVVHTSPSTWRTRRTRPRVVEHDDAGRRHLELRRPDHLAQRTNVIGHRHDGQSPRWRVAGLRYRSARCKALQRVPILAYHATNIDGNDYATNDHVAFAHDLRLIDALGFRVVALSDVVDALLGDAPLPERSVALTFDDGTDFDFHDRMHPTHGLQRGMLNILRDFVAEHGRQRQPQAARDGVRDRFARSAGGAGSALDDRRRLVGRRLVAASGRNAGSWAWRTTAGTTTMRVVSAAVPRTAATGTFRSHRHLGARRSQIRQARAYIDAKAPNAAADLFAYPFGETNRVPARRVFSGGPRANGRARRVFDRAGARDRESESVAAAALCVRRSVEDVGRPVEILRNST